MQVNDATMKEMQLLLEFMYKGAVIIPAENYDKVAQIADQLEMTNFRKFTDNEDKKNFFHSLNMAKVRMTYFEIEKKKINTENSCETDGIRCWKFCHLFFIFFLHTLFRSVQFSITLWSISRGITAIVIGFKLCNCLWIVDVNL